MWRREGGLVCGGADQMFDALREERISKREKFIDEKLSLSKDEENKLNIKLLETFQN